MFIETKTDEQFKLLKELNVFIWKPPEQLKLRGIGPRIYTKIGWGFWAI